MKKTAIVFLRVSKREQIHQRQITNIQEYATKHSIEIKEWIKIKISGSKVKEYKDLIYDTAIKHKVDYVMFEEVSRIGREISTTTTLKKQCHDKGIGFLITSQHLNTMPDGKKVDATQDMIVNQYLNFAECWAKLHGDRIMGGQRASKKKIGRPKGIKASPLLILEIRKGNKKILDALKRYHQIKPKLSIRKIAKQLSNDKKTVHASQVFRIKKLAIAEGLLKA